MPVWLSKDMVEVFHRESLALFGGADGTRDEGLLLSALARAENLYSYHADADIFSLAAAYCVGVVKNHPFIDGNKRTGILAAIAFLAINDVQVEFEEAEIASMIISLAASEVSETEIANWLRRSAT
jgi:death on curing protein